MSDDQLTPEEAEKFKREFFERHKPEDIPVFDEEEN